MLVINFLHNDGDSISPWSFYITLSWYSLQDDNCRYNPEASGAEDKGFVDIREGSEHALKKAVATMGPVSVAIDASHESFQFYHKGEDTTQALKQLLLKYMLQFNLNYPRILLFKYSIWVL